MSRQAIRTRYLGPTNFRDSRVVATCDAKRIVVSWDHALNPEDNHTDAAKKLANMLGWHGTWYAGLAKGDHGYTFVWATDPAFVVTAKELVWATDPAFVVIVKEKDDV